MGWWAREGALPPNAPTVDTVRDKPVLLRAMPTDDVGERAPRRHDGRLAQAFARHHKGEAHARDGRSAGPARLQRGREARLQAELQGGDGHGHHVVRAEQKGWRRGEGSDGEGVPRASGLDAHGSAGLLLSLWRLKGGRDEALGPIWAGFPAGLVAPQLA